MEFILPLIIACFAFPLLALAASVVVAIFYTIACLCWPELRERSFKANAESCLIYSMMLSVPLACIGSLAVFMLPNLLYEQNKTDYRNKSLASAKEFAQWFDGISADLLKATKPDDNAIQKLKEKLSQYGKYKFQLGPIHGNVRELSIERVGDCKISELDIASAIMAKHKGEWLVGEPFVERRSKVMFGGRKVRAIRSEEFYNRYRFLANRNAAGDGIDVIFYAREPIDKECGDHLNAIVIGRLTEFECSLLDDVRLMPFSKMTDEEPTQPLKNLDKRVGELLTADEKSRKDGVFSKVPCVAHCPTGLNPYIHSDHLGELIPWYVDEAYENLAANGYHLRSRYMDAHAIHPLK